MKMIIRYGKNIMEGKTENCCNITYNKKAFTTVSQFTLDNYVNMESCFPLMPK